MKTKKPGILILTPFFSPNIGGVETHLDDLTKELDRLNYPVFVQTYSPITTPNVIWKNFERRGRNIQIFRHHLLGKNLFHYLENFSVIELFYLTPVLLIQTFCWLNNNHQKISVIHSQGLTAGLIGVILKLFFKKKLIISTHAIYSFNSTSFFGKIAAVIFNHADSVLCLSKFSARQLAKFGVNSKKISFYRYWIDLKLFKPGKIKKTKNVFTILFVGRLIKQKGIYILTEIAKFHPNWRFVFIGVGPEQQTLKKLTSKYSNIKLLTNIKHSKLPFFYQSANITCVPSLYPEGYGRVIMESIACVTPVLASNQGAIKEVVDHKVAILSKPTFLDFNQQLTNLKKNGRLLKLSKNCHKYAKKKFGPKNILLITKYY